MLSVVKGSGWGLSELPKEEEWAAKEVQFIKDKVSELPQSPNCPSLIELNLQRNSELTAIPPLFFHRMARLQVLDLSYTSIKSLPKSLPKLVALKKLLLRGCELFMQLSPHVGELKKLEELDLDQTQIIDLPQEMGKLLNLTSLRVSFYPICGKKMSKSNILIHPETMSVLSRLAKLSIDVDPSDKRWDDSVEAVVKEARNSKTLETLVLYLPKFQLLDSISSIYPSLSSFRFTVGHHRRRIISRVPQEVEAEFRNWKKCLKFVKGETIPVQIKVALKYSTSLFLEQHATATSLSGFGVKDMKRLKFCVLAECNMMETIVDGERQSYDQNEENRLESVPTAIQNVLESLEYLKIYYMENLEHLWRGPSGYGYGCMSRLKVLEIHACPQLIHVFAPALLENLVHLEDLILEDCPQVTTLISPDAIKLMSNTTYLPSLKRLLLLYLPELLTISNGLLIAPNLEMIGFYNCPKLKCMSKMELSSRVLKIIKGERKWWADMNWNESEWGSRPDYLMRLFSPINNEKDVMTQLTEDYRDLFEAKIENECQQPALSDNWEERPIGTDVKDSVPSDCILSTVSPSKQQDMRFIGSSSRDEFFEKPANILGNLHHHGQFQQLRSSKYLAPAQELLNELCSPGIKQNDALERKQTHETKKHWDDKNKSSSSGKQSLSSLDLMELRMRETKLTSMVDEVDRRYRHYCDQRKVMVSSLEAVAGTGAASVYSADCKKAMSRHFRCLRDGIVSQILATSEAMGEKLVPVAPGTTRGETPRLSILDQAPGQQSAVQQVSMMESHPSRPQRGLPERSVSVLRAWLFEHFLHPYPSDADRHNLACLTGLSRSQISNWFINARVRLWKPLVEEMYMEETKEHENNMASSDGATDDDDDGDGSWPNQEPPASQKRTSDQLVGVHSECMSSMTDDGEESIIGTHVTNSNPSDYILPTIQWSKAPEQAWRISSEKNKWLEDDYVDVASEICEADDNEDEPKAKRWNCSENETKDVIGSARVAVPMRTNVEVFDDGYKWEKYKTETVQGRLLTRHYYRCLTHGCPVTKKIEQHPQDTSIVLTTYKGQHNHDLTYAKRFHDCFSTVSQDPLADDMEDAAQTTSSTKGDGIVSEASGEDKGLHPGCKSIKCVEEAVSSIDPDNVSSSYRVPWSKMDMSLDLKLGQVGNTGDVSMKTWKEAGKLKNSCLVDDCNSDLSNSKDYHRRHKVCERHSKASKVMVNSKMQRFCQQCSRYRRGAWR